MLQPLSIAVGIGAGVVGTFAVAHIAGKVVESKHLKHLEDRDLKSWCPMCQAVSEAAHTV